MLAGSQEIAGALVGKEILEELLKKGLDKLAERFVGYKGLGMLFKTLGTIIGPVITILINVIPDLLRLIFGKSKEQKISELQEKISSIVISKVVETMRPHIEEMISEQRGNVDKNLEAIIENETRKYDDNIRAIMEQQEQEKEAIAKKVAELQECIEKLNKLVREL